MTNLKGQCHCGNIQLAAEVTAAPETIQPRACDCDFCTKHGAAFVSDPQGRLTISIRDPDLLRRYKQGSNTADFLLCSNCGVAAGVVYRDDGRTLGALNFRLLDEASRFAAPIVVSPKKLSPGEKTDRWRQVWFRDVQIQQPEFPSNVPLSAIAAEVPPRAWKTNYPETFAARVSRRTKRVLGDLFGIRRFGVNLTELHSGGESALLHKHTVQEEFVYVLRGHPTLVTEDKEIQLSPGACAGFTPRGPAHQLVNRTDEPVVYLEMGTRLIGDEASYPKDDLVAVMGDDGKWRMTHKDGRPY